jgi:hypothetical protein
MTWLSLLTRHVASVERRTYDGRKDDPRVRPSPASRLASPSAGASGETSGRRSRRVATGLCGGSVATRARQSGRLCEVRAACPEVQRTLSLEKRLLVRSPPSFIAGAIDAFELLNRTSAADEGLTSNAVLRIRRFDCRRLPERRSRTEGECGFRKMQVARRLPSRASTDYPLTLRKRVQ